MILVFDSGVGGLSVAAEVRKRLPDTPIHYLMDNACFPYGVREDHDLQPRIVDLCEQGCSQWPIELLIVACNTASTLALEELREKLSVPVVGVVPAIKPAAALSRNGVIGLLATPATVRRPYTDRLIEDFAMDCDVRRLGTSQLVELAEYCLEQTPEPDWLQQQLRACLEDWLATPPRPDVIVLGCTHFPVLKSHLHMLWPDVLWIDSGDAIARRVCQLDQHRPLDRSGAVLHIHWTGTQQPALAGLQHIWPHSEPVSFTEFALNNDTEQQQLIQ